MNVSKYLITTTVIILERLFLEGDEIYIEYYDPVAGRPQMVFLNDRTLIGKISSDLYWQLEKKIIQLKKITT